MVRYFYVWTPLVIVGAVVLLALPWLGLIALVLVALVTLATLAWALVFVPYTLGQAISHRWQRTATRPRTATAGSRVPRPRSVPAVAAMLLASHPRKRDT